MRAQAAAKVPSRDIASTTVIETAGPVRKQSSRPRGVRGYRDSSTAGVSPRTMQTPALPSSSRSVTEVETASGTAATTRTQQRDVGAADCRSARCLRPSCVGTGFAGAGRHEREQAPTASSGTAACPGVATLLTHVGSGEVGLLAATTFQTLRGSSGVTRFPIRTKNSASARSRARKTPFCSGARLPAIPPPPCRQSSPWRRNRVPIRRSRHVKKGRHAEHCLELFLAPALIDNRR